MTLQMLYGPIRDYRNPCSIRRINYDACRAVVRRLGTSLIDTVLLSDHPFVSTALRQFVFKPPSQLPVSSISSDVIRIIEPEVNAHPFSPYYWSI